MRSKPDAPFLLLAAVFLLAGCATKDRENTIVISIPEQRMLLLKRDIPMATFPVSTSKFGIGDTPGSNATPLGKFEVAKKIGEGAPAGMKFKDRKPTGEIVPVDAPGRDPIVTRILWLRGMEAQNRNAFRRTIYIHGTPEERSIGQPASYGCVRMKSADIERLFETVGTGASVEIRDAPLPAANVGG